MSHLLPKVCAPLGGDLGSRRANALGFAGAGKQWAEHGSVGAEDRGQHRGVEREAFGSVNDVVDGLLALHAMNVGTGPTDMSRSTLLSPVVHALFTGPFPARTSRVEQMVPLGSLQAFAVASFLLLIIPGPAVIYILNRSVSDGREVALSAVAGLELGNFMHVIAASAGLSAVLAASSAAFNTVKWLGAGYLVVVGMRTLLVRPTSLTTTVSSMPRSRAFRQGFVVNTLNPKVALFFLSFLPQFIDPDRGAAWLQSLLLGIVFVAIGAVTDSTYAITASSLRAILLKGRALPFVQRWVAGSVFVLLGVMAAGASTEG
jgi:threonine/homoserine/homoserine lactone efflux protein